MPYGAPAEVRRNRVASAAIRESFHGRVAASITIENPGIAKGNSHQIPTQ